MSTAEISVIIPAFNAESTITAAIHSVLQQTTLPLEIIVVDDGSTDQTATVVKQLSESSLHVPVRLIRQPNSRTAAARNRGIEQSSGQWVAFLDADDYWETDKLTRQVETLQRHPEVTLLAGRYLNQFPGQPAELPVWRDLGIFDRVLDPKETDAFQIGTVMWTGTVLVKRTSLGTHRFVSGLEPAEDRDLWIRLAASQCVFIDSHPLATAVLEPGSISRSSIAVDCQNMLQVIDRNADLTSFASRRRWRSYVQYRWAANDPSPAVGIQLLMRSFLQWPLPFHAMPSVKRLGRIKRLIVLATKSHRKLAKPTDGSVCLKSSHQEPSLQHRRAAG
jgi:glycosyltransferase involved in cell wall biosynthesis